MIILCLVLDNDDVTDDDEDTIHDDYNSDHIHTYLHGERVNEMTSLAQVQAVKPDEPIGGRDHFCQEGHLKM